MKKKFVDILPGELFEIPLLLGEGSHLGLKLEDQRAVNTATNCLCNTTGMQQYEFVISDYELVPEMKEEKSSSKQDLDSSGCSMERAVDRTIFRDLKTNKFHRNNDLPAIVFDSGQKQWYKQGKIHRETGPAVILPDGGQYYYLNDLFYPSKREWESALQILKMGKYTLKDSVLEINGYKYTLVPVE